MKRYILRQGLKLLQLHGHSISKYNLPELIFSRDAIFQGLCIIWINFYFFQKQCCCKLCISQDVAKVPPDGQLAFHGNSSFELKRIVSLVLHLMLLQIHQSRCCQGHLLIPSCNTPIPTPPHTKIQIFLCCNTYTCLTKSKTILNCTSESASFFLPT